MTMRFSPSVDNLIADYGLPAGYERLPWANAQKGQAVWIYGTTLDEDGGRSGQAYGPFTVRDVAKRQLVNKCGKQFPELQESLLCPTSSKTDTAPSTSATAAGPTAAAPASSAPAPAPRPT